MREDIKKQIEGLKEVVLNLYRSAGSLDEYIRLLESELESPGCNDEYMEIYAKQIAGYRMDLKTRRGYDKLDEREKDIWQQLINAVKEGETH